MRVDAYQMKWRMYGGNFTFSDLTKSSDDTPSLIAQLADGWQRLRSAHPGQRMVMHLITSATPSVGDSATMPVGPQPPTPRHFAAFLDQVWRPARSAQAPDHWTVPPAWQPAWAALRTASKLSDVDFAQFMHDCELEFGYQLPDDGDQLHHQQVSLHDLQQLTEQLFATVAHPQQLVELTRDALLTTLGWHMRYEYRSRHEFPVDELLYQPIMTTVEQLQHALLTLPGGYIAVLGTPGSGKSTLLTHTLRPYPARVLRYYAYVPDAQDPVTTRGESVNFLHDIVLGLERAGFRSSGSRASDRAQLLQQLAQQLQLLHTNWQTTGQATIILLDGLDHIAREQHPQRSLLYDLPLPEQVPDGVYFVLGSQTDQLVGLPDRIQYAIRQPGRRIEMQPLSRAAVLRVIERATIPDIDADQPEQIYRLAGGHPLALVYLLQQLQTQPDAAARQKVLDLTERYTGNIEVQYFSYWKQIATDDELIHVLGLLARLRRVIDLTWIRGWAGRAVIERLRRTVGLYFRHEDEQRWYFFHNSFRLFLLAATAEATPGVMDAAQDRELHHELAEHCARAPAASPWSWEELYHRVLADEHPLVLQRSTALWFRQQVQALRPLDAVRTDIQLALRSATAQQDVLAVVRLLFAAAEVEQRINQLDHTSPLELYLGLGKYAVAVEHIRDGQQLRVIPKAALEVCRELHAVGWAEEARRIFDLAEPLDLLMVNAPLGPTHHQDQQKQDELLAAWAAAAVLFRSTDQLLTTIHGLRRSGDEFERQTADQATSHLHNWLRLTLGTALVEQSRWNDVARVSASFALDQVADQSWWFWLQVRAWRSCTTTGDQTQAHTLIAATLRVAPALQLDAMERVVLAEGVYRILGDSDAARTLVAGLAQPALVNEVRIDVGLQPFLLRFRLNRLFYALGSDATPTTIIPDASDPRQQGLVYFERILCVIANLWAQAWRGRPLPPALLIPDLRPLLRFFNRTHRDTNEWMGWYTVKYARAEFYKLVIDMVAQHGLAAVEALQHTFEREWNDPVQAPWWPSDIRRAVLLAFFNVGVEPAWIEGQLASLELHASNVYDRLRGYLQQAQAWLTLGRPAQAEQQLQRLLQSAFTVGNEKDYQLDHWIQLLDRVNQVQPERAAERIQWFTRALQAVWQSTEGGAERSAAKQLLAATFRWSPSAGLTLAQWLQREQMLHYTDALHILLTAALAHPQPPSALALVCLVNMYIPFTGKGDSELAALCIEQVARIRGTTAAQAAVQAVGECIVRDALPSTRSTWLQGVQQAAQRLHLPLPPFAHTSVPPTSDQERGGAEQLRLQDGSVLSLAAVHARVGTLADVQALRQVEAQPSYFHWEPVVAQVAERLQRADLLRLGESFQTDSYAAAILSRISRRLLALGHPGDAWTVAEQAVVVGSPTGWSRFYYGGSRLAALGALSQADAVRARPLVYQTLLHDVRSNTWLPESITANLEAVLPLLADHIPMTEVWSECEQYVQTLFETMSLEMYAAPDLSPGTNGDLPEQALAQLLADCIGHPINRLSLAAQRSVGQLLLQGNPTMQAIVGACLAGPEVVQEHLLVVLDAVSQQDPRALTTLHRPINALQYAPNYAIRYVARLVAQRLGLEVAVDVPRLIVLPPAYALELPLHGGATLREGKDDAVHEALPDTQDPARIVQAYQPELRVVAQAADLDYHNLCVRTVQTMHQLRPVTAWSAQGEQQLRDQLSAAGLRYTYRRPRTSLVRRALFHVIGELVDAGLLEPAQLGGMPTLLRFYDPAFLFVRPTVRPPEIPPLQDWQARGANAKEWLALTNATEHVARLIQPDMTVLAEDTALKHLGWRMPTEVRHGVVCLASASPPQRTNDSERFFQRVDRHLVADYQQVHVEETPIPLIIQHRSYGYDTEGSEWLALHPPVGYQLGWQPEGDGLFRWVDATRQRMVETIWWTDGVYDQSETHHTDEVAEGWLVVASTAALDQIRARYGPLKRQIMIARSFQEDGLERVSNSTSIEQTLA